MDNQVKCPKCGEVFQIDESAYIALVKQIRDKEFEKQLHEKEQQLIREKDNAVEKTKLETSDTFKDEIAQRDLKIKELELKIENVQKDNTIELNKLSNEKDKQIHEKETEFQKKQIELERKFDTKLAGKNTEIEKLKADSQIAINKAISEKENIITT